MVELVYKLMTLDFNAGTPSLRAKRIIYIGHSPALICSYSLGKVFGIFRRHQRDLTPNILINDMAYTAPLRLCAVFRYIYTLVRAAKQPSL